MSKKIAKVIAKLSTSVKGNARILTKIFAVIGLICVFVWFIVHFWTVVKVCIGIAVLGIVCGGISLGSR